MATNFPTSLDTFTNPTSTDTLDSPSHSTQHANANDAIEALEAKVGIDSSAVNTSHDFKLAGVGTGDKAVSLTGTETLTNKTLTSPVINNPTGTLAVSDEDFVVGDNADSSKSLDFELSGATASTKTTIAALQTANRTVTLPDITDTLVSLTATQTLTNKTIDSANNTLTIDASEATVSNLDVADFSTSAIVTEADTISGNDNDTTIPTSAAVKDYVDTTSTTNKVATSPVDTEIADNTGTETDIVSEQIDAGTLGTNNAIEGRIYVSNYTMDSGNNPATFRLKYGSTTIASISHNVTSSDITLSGHIDFSIIADGATGAQIGSIECHFGNATDADAATREYLHSLAAGTAAEDSTTNLNVSVTIQWQNATPTHDFVPAGYTVKRIT